MSVLDEARAVLSYCPETGVFTRLKSGGRKRAGDRAGYARSDGYWMVFVDGKWRLAHRLAWLMTHGEWPADEIDHINGVRDDNRIANLRAATRSQNMMNANIGNGWHWHKPSGQWQALIRVNGTRKFLGRFATEADARNAYEQAQAELHGDYAFIEPPPAPKQEAMAL